MEKNPINAENQDSKQTVNPNPSHQDKSEAINNFLSEIVIFSKYAGIVQGENRKQTWNECVDVFQNMLIKDHPELSDEIIDNCRYIREKKAFPSMRSMQYGGDPISFNPTRIYNCSFLHADDIKVFSEFIWILLSGAGIGASIQKRHTDKIPAVGSPNGKKRFLVSDSIEGWADSIRMLMYAYFRGNPYPEFDYRDIRKEGSPIKKLNCLAPGPKKLINTINEVDKILKNAVGRKLTQIEYLDIICHIADCVVSGGIRTSAVIVLFDKDEESIINGKAPIKIDNAELISEDEEYWHIKITVSDKEIFHGDTEKTIKLQKKWGDFDKNKIMNDHICEWYYAHPQRSMSNNSVVLHRDNTTYEEFMKVMKMAYESGSGEPGIMWTNDYDMGTNPCFAGDSMLLMGNNSYVKMEEAYEKGGYEKYNKSKSENAYGKIRIINSNGNVEATNVYLTSTMDHLYKVTMSNGSEQKTTQNHNFIVYDEKGKKIRKKLIDLKLTDRIPLPNFDKILTKSNFQFKGENEIADATITGLVLANGSSSQIDSENKKIVFRVFKSEYEISEIDKTLKTLQNAKIVFNAAKAEHEKFIEYSMIVPYSYKEVSKIGNSKAMIMSRFLKNLNNEISQSFLCSYIGSCGNISINKEKATIRCWSDDRKFLQDIQLLLSSFGIYSSVLVNKPKKHANELIKMTGNNVVTNVDGYNLFINGYYYVNKFLNKIGFFYANKHNKVIDLLEKMDKTVVEKQSRPMTYIRPISVEYIGKGATYCLTEPKNNEIIVNGSLIGNCGEISLKSGQFCNLSTINAYDIDTQEEFNKRAEVCAFFGTMQASYTNFHYLRPMWKEKTEEDALLGVSMTGIASGKIFKLDESIAAMSAVKENERVSALIGINPASRVTTVKPEGTTTLVAKVFGAGAHSAFEPFFVRNLRIRKNDPIYSQLSIIYADYIEQDYMDEDRVVLSIPMKADKDCIFRSEPTINFLNRIKRLNEKWIRPGHKSGNNFNNVSSTVSIKDGEIEEVSQWMWDNKEYYNGITILPYNGGTYKQAPYIEITEEEYERLAKDFPVDFNFADVFIPDFTDIKRESACSGGGCDVKEI